MHLPFMFQDSFDDLYFMCFFLWDVESSWYFCTSSVLILESLASYCFLEEGTFFLLLRKWSNCLKMLWDGSTCARLLSGWGVVVELWALVELVHWAETASDRDAHPSLASAGSPCGVVITPSRLTVVSVACRLDTKLGLLSPSRLTVVSVMLLGLPSGFCDTRCSLEGLLVSGQVNVCMCDSVPLSVYWRRINAGKIPAALRHSSHFCFRCKSTSGNVADL